MKNLVSVDETSLDLGVHKTAAAPCVLHCKCSRTQMQTILKNQESITRDYETNPPAARKRLRGPQYEDVDSTLYDWYCLARQMLVPVTGPMLQEEALIIACSLEESMISKHLMVGFKDLKTETTQAACGEQRIGRC